MAATLDSDRPVFEQEDLRTPLRAEGLPQEILRPVIAGAFARGIADTFELLELSALFLDREGRILFVTERAKSMLSDALQIRSGHLLARARKDNRAVADFVAEALRDPASRPSVSLHSSGLRLRALPLPDHAGQTDQLLHAVVLVEDSVRRSPNEAAADAG